MTEVLCKACVVWGTPDAFAEHGPMLNTPIMVQKRRGCRAPGYLEYPAAYQDAYNAARRAEEQRPMRGLSGAELRQVIGETVRRLGERFEE